MAVLRLIACVALVACRASEAGSPSGLTPPPGWQPLPALAAAAGDAAKQANITADGIEAWGEPARGCYAAWFSLEAAAGAPARIAERLVASLTADVPVLTVADVIQPDAQAESGVLSLAFTRPPYRGHVRATIAKTGAITLLACYANQREPIACDAACNTMLGAIK